MKNIKKLKQKTWVFLVEESGQTTTEYVLLLLMVVLAVRAVGGTIRQRLTSLIGSVFQVAETEAQRTGE